jgi:hypothetical protein
LRFYLIDGERIVHLLSWHPIQTEAELGEALKDIQEAGLIPEDRVRLCVICDGASGIWEHVKALFSSACQVLDYYHCSDYLHRMTKAQYGDSQQAREWVEATLTRLYLGKISAVLGGLGRMRATSEEAPQAISKPGRFCTNIGVEPTISSFVEGAIRWAAVGLKRPTSSFAIPNSSAQGLGGTRSIATRC